MNTPVPGLVSPRLLSRALASSCRHASRPLARLRTIVGLALLLPTLAACPGCALFVSPLSFFSQEQEIVNGIALFELAGRGTPEGNLYRWLPTVDGRRRIKVRAMPLLSSNHITQMEVVTGEDGRSVLRATLDAHGRMIWMQVCAEYAGREIAVAVDGLLRFPMVIPRLSGDATQLLIPGDWTPREAKDMAERATKNYYILRNRTE